MDKSKKETKIVKQSYDYTFLSDMLEMIRGYCCFINYDKKLLNLFTEIIAYVNSKFPDIDGKEIEYELLVKIT